MCLYTALPYTATLLHLHWFWSYTCHEWDFKRKSFMLRGVLSWLKGQQGRMDRNLINSRLHSSKETYKWYEAVGNPFHEFNRAQKTLMKKPHENSRNFREVGWTQKTREHQVGSGNSQSTYGQRPLALGLDESWAYFRVTLLLGSSQRSDHSKTSAKAGLQDGDYAINTGIDIQFSLQHRHSPR